MKIKVCGLREPDNIHDVDQLPIDWVGFIFYPKSPRFVASEHIYVQAIKNCKRAKVGVFVDASPEDILDQVATFHLDYAQLHGDETPEICFQLQKRGCRIIKSFAIENANDCTQTNEYEGYVDYFLFDTPTKAYGGSGKRFNWLLLDAYEGKTPFLLSGGISPESLEDILQFNHPRMAGIDLNSGFEIKPGLKDTAKLKTFINSLHQSI